MKVIIIFLLLFYDNAHNRALCIDICLPLQTELPKDEDYVLLIFAPPGHIIVLSQTSKYLLNEYNLIILQMRKLTGK